MLFQEEIAKVHIALWPQLPYPPIPDCFGQFFQQPQCNGASAQKELDKS
jgi:hypothetical protein